MTDMSNLQNRLFLLGSDGKSYVKNDDGTLSQVEHSNEFHGFGVGIEALGISEEEAKAQSEEQDVTGHHGWHTFMAYGVYFDIFLGAWVEGWHRH